MPWYRAPPFQLGVFAAAVAIFLSACVVWPSGILVGRWRGRETQPQPRLARLARVWAGTTVVVNLVAVFLVAVTLSRVTQPSVAVEFQPGLPRMLALTIDVATVFAALALAVPVLAVVAWVRRYWTFAGRVHYSLLAAASLGYVWFCSVWKLINF